ncbi:MAG: hypothetical protein A4E28_02071 [Methanocella sp. PtaU1.Bin125]|nr:MAG: hypothetical protein A4E28_02071 [Methanocella sp. PtaU1.Bin125]
MFADELSDVVQALHPVPELYEVLFRLEGPEHSVGEVAGQQRGVDREIVGEPDLADRGPEHDQVPDQEQQLSRAVVLQHPEREHDDGDERYRDRPVEPVPQGVRVEHVIVTRGRVELEDRGHSLRDREHASLGHEYAEAQHDEPVYLREYDVRDEQADDRDAAQRHRECPGFSLVLPEQGGYGVHDTHACKCQAEEQRLGHGIEHELEAHVLDRPGQHHDGWYQVQQRRDNDQVIQRFAPHVIDDRLGDEVDEEHEAEQ